MTLYCEFNMDETSSYICDHCGEEIVVAIDLSAGGSQQYVEDCPVCCNPNLIDVQINGEGNVEIWAENPNKIDVSHRGPSMAAGDAAGIIDPMSQLPCFAGMQNLITALNHYLAAVESARAFVKSVVDPPMELMFDDTVSFQHN